MTMIYTVTVVRDLKHSFIPKQRIWERSQAFPIHIFHSVALWIMHRSGRVAETGRPGLIDHINDVRQTEEAQL